MKNTSSALSPANLLGGVISSLKSAVSTAKVMAVSTALALCFAAVPNEGYGQAWDPSTNPVYLSNQSANVGIGLNNPTHRIHIESFGGDQGIFVNSLERAAYLRLSSNNTRPIEIYAPNNSDDMRFFVNGTDRMTISNSGNVGISTLTPNALLSLGSSTSNTKLTIFQGSSTLLSAGIGWQTNQMRFHLNNDNNSSFLFLAREGSSELVRFSTGGRNGFGTTTPLNRMDINGAMAVGSAYAGTVTAPANGAIIQGELGVGKTTITPGLKIEASGGNIGQSTAGNFGGIALGDRWNALGDRIPFTTTPGFASTGVRSQWDQYGANFGLIERQNIFVASTVRDGLVSWQDATTLADPNTLTANNSRLRFIFRNGNVPSATPNALEAMTILANGRVGIRQNEPVARLQVEEGNIGQAEIGYAASDGKWNSLGQETNFSQYFGQFANWKGNAIEMGIGKDQATGDPETPSINWYSALGIKKDLIFNFMDAYNIAPTREIMRMRPDGNVGIGTNSPGSLFSVAGGVSIGSGYSTLPAPPNGMIIEDTVFIGTSTALLGSSGELLQLNGEARATGFWLPSDERYKKNINRIEGALLSILNINGVSYEWRINDFENLNLPKNLSNGVLAQELKRHIPNAVKEGRDSFLSVNYDAIIPVLIEAIKELNQKIEYQSNESNSFKVSSSIKEIKSSGHELFQNRPNPFSTSTVIDYQLGKEFRSAYIQIFEPTGKPLMKFENLLSGKNSIEVQAGNLSSGLYLYALVVDGRLIAQKSMIVE
jgi:hypothetical protein